MKVTRQAPPSDPRLVADAAGTEWSTGYFPAHWRTGTALFMPMLRAPGDPSRRSREARQAHRRLQNLDNYEWIELRKKTAAQWREIILTHMDDGQARSANRIAVEICDHTADIMGELFYEALFDLAEDGWLEHTTKTPILWRARMVSHESVTLVPLPHPCNNPRCAACDAHHGEERAHP